MYGVLILGGLAGGALYGFQELMYRRRVKTWRAERPQTETYNYFARLDAERRLRPPRDWIVPAVIALAIVLFVGADPGRVEHNGDITYYCEYGAVSQAQLDHCKTHVSSGYIDKLDTNAARWSRGELSDCRADSGPFCDPSSYHNDVEIDG